MKKLLFFLSFFYSLSILSVKFKDVSNKTLLQRINDVETIKSMNIQLINTELYPKTVLFFEELTKKYPDLLTDKVVCTSKLPDFLATASIILLGSNVLQELERENKYTQDLTEWTILHEAGHINNNHIQKCMLIQKGAAFTTLLALIMYGFSNKSYVKEHPFASYTIYIFLSNLSNSIIYQVYLWYSSHVVEPEADALANSRCLNIEALKNAKTFIDSFPDDAYHHPKSVRLEAIDKAIDSLQKNL